MILRPHLKPLVGGVIKMIATSFGIVGYSELAADQAKPPEERGFFICSQPYHHDGDAIRCGGSGRSMRLYGIDTPEMPGACRPGRNCTAGDPIAARDHLRGLSAGKVVQCEQLDRDRYGRPIVRCSADGIDLSCAMVSDGYAVKRYAPLTC